jgi:hypothetical protein
MSPGVLASALLIQVLPSLKLPHTKPVALGPVAHVTETLSTFGPTMTALGSAPLIAAT